MTPSAPQLPNIAHQEPIDLGLGAPAPTSAVGNNTMSYPQSSSESSPAGIPFGATHAQQAQTLSSTTIPPTTTTTMGTAGDVATRTTPAAPGGTDSLTMPVADTTLHSQSATSATPVAVDAPTSATATVPMTMATTPATPAPAPPPAPPKINVKILVISGQTKIFSFEQETTVGRMKELVWNMWPTEWNKEPSQPESPAYLRVLHMGRILGDEQTLSSLNIPIAPKVTIMHLSVRTFPIGEDEGAKKSIVSTLLRPGALVTRNSSHNVQTTANAHANANNARQQQGSQRNRGSTVAAGGVARNGSSSAAAAGTGTANSSRANAQDGSSHGGGCKCVIM